MVPTIGIYQDIYGSYVLKIYLFIDWFNRDSFNEHEPITSTQRKLVSTCRTIQTMIFTEVRKYRWINERSQNMK